MCGRHHTSHANVCCITPSASSWTWHSRSRIHMSRQAAATRRPFRIRKQHCMLSLFCVALYYIIFLLRSGHMCRLLQVLRRLPRGSCEYTDVLWGWGLDVGENVCFVRCSSIRNCVRPTCACALQAHAQRGESSCFCAGEHPDPIFRTNVCACLRMSASCYNYSTRCDATNVVGGHAACMQYTYIIHVRGV